MAEENGTPIYCAYEQRNFPSSEFKTTDDGVVVHVGPEEQRETFVPHTTLGERFGAERLPGTKAGAVLPPVSELHAIHY